MFIRKMRQTWMLVIAFILYVIGTVIMFSTLGHMIWCFGFAIKVFLSTIFLATNVHPWMRQSWILIIISIHFVMGTTIMFSSLGYTILRLWTCNKSFPSTIFLLIKGHSWNEANLYTHNNHHYFCYWYYNHVLQFRMHDLDALDLQISLHHFPHNQSSSLKWNKLGYL